MAFIDLLYWTVSKDRVMATALIAAEGLLTVFRDKAVFIYIIAV